MFRSGSFNSYSSADPFDDVRRRQGSSSTFDAGTASKVRRSITSSLNGIFPPLPLASASSVDAKLMRQRVKSSLLRPQYNVQDAYYKNGVFQAIARHQHFEYISLCMIALNACWIWVDTDLNSAAVVVQADAPFQVVEHIFCIFFTLEWFVRFMSFQQKREGFRDGWFLFDSTLVTMMILETWVMSIIILCAGGATGGDLGNASVLRVARLLRLSRMARMVRLFRRCPELLILVKGIAAATRSVFFTLCLLIILLFIFGVAFRQLTDGLEMGKMYFGSVARSMYTLLISGAFMDNLGVVVKQVGAESVLCAVLFWIFVLSSSLTVMNMLIGVLCEVVSAVATSERETMMVNFVKDRMNTLFHKLDTSCDGQLSREEFCTILEKPEAARLLEEVGVDVLGLVDQVDTIFTEELLPGVTEPVERQLSFVELMEVILDQRGGNKATVKHIVELRKTMHSAITEQNKVLVRVEARLDGVPCQTPSLLCGEDSEDCDAEPPAASLSAKIRPSLLALEQQQHSKRPSGSFSTYVTTQTQSPAPEMQLPIIVDPSRLGPSVLHEVSADMRRLAERLEHLTLDFSRKSQEDGIAAEPPCVAAPATSPSPNSEPSAALPQGALPLVAPPQAEPAEVPLPPLHSAPGLPGTPENVPVQIPRSNGRAATLQATLHAARQAAAEQAEGGSSANATRPPSRPSLLIVPSPRRNTRSQSLQSANSDKGSQQQATSAPSGRREKRSATLHTTGIPGGTVCSTIAEKPVRGSFRGLHDLGAWTRSPAWPSSAGARPVSSGLRVTRHTSGAPDWEELKSDLETLLTRLMDAVQQASAVDGSRCDKSQQRPQPLSSGGRRSSPKGGGLGGVGRCSESSIASLVKLD